jgi:hypothetical protein
MNDQKRLDDERAFRIALRIKENHLLLSNLYENLVDREFSSVEKDAKKIILDLRLILKSIPDDDF